MAKLEKLSTARLNELIDETQIELRRRKNIDAAVLEIISTLKKYKIAFHDVEAKIVAKTSLTKSKKKGAKLDRRSVIKAKFKDPKSPSTWTGRGRSPSWVLRICEAEGIDITAFKTDPRFKC